MLRKLPYVLILVALTIVTIFYPATSLQMNANAQAGCQRFDQTGHTLCGRFLQYWQQHGALAQQGYPVSEPFSEMSDTDGKLYTVQYFERAVFEMHTENRAPNDVLLSLLGRFQFKAKFPNGAPKQVPNTLSGSQLFPQTAKRLGGSFLTYWQSHGGLAQQGYPISDEFLETSATDGKVYKVQYFERAVFEAHPEKQAPYDVLLSLLGTFRLGAKYGDGSSLPSAPGFASGGLGLTRTEWERLHGRGLEMPDPEGEVRKAQYEGTKYTVFYSDDDLITALIVEYPNDSIVKARAKSKEYVPSDTQVVKADLRADPPENYDLCFSQWLSTVYPPGTSPWFGTSYSDIWLGTSAGTFDVEYHLNYTNTGVPKGTMSIFIHAGDNN